jgi:hypothetical protein
MQNLKYLNIEGNKNLKLTADLKRFVKKRRDEIY